MRKFSVVIFTFIFLLFEVISSEEAYIQLMYSQQYQNNNSFNQITDFVNNNELQTLSNPTSPTIQDEAYTNCLLVFHKTKSVSGCNKPQNFKEILNKYESDPVFAEAYDHSYAEYQIECEFSSPEDQSEKCKEFSTLFSEMNDFASEDEEFEVVENHFEQLSGVTLEGRVITDNLLNKIDSHNYVDYESTQYQENDSRYGENDDFDPNKIIYNDSVNSYQSEDLPEVSVDQNLTLNSDCLKENGLNPLESIAHIAPFLEKLIQNGSEDNLTVNLIFCQLQSYYQTVEPTPWDKIDYLYLNVDIELQSCE